MVLETKKNHQGLLAILVGIALTSFLLTNCNAKQHNDDTQNLLLLALASKGTETDQETDRAKVEFRLSDQNTLLSARSQSSQTMRVGSDAGFLVDPVGENPQNYGDGIGDGYNDHFATPSAVSIEVCFLLAYKSEKNGGPRKGTETFKNASKVLYDPEQYSTPDELANIDRTKPCPSAVRVALKGLNMNQQTPYESVFGKTIDIPKEERPQYDRIGIIARSFSYYFHPNDVPEDSYRYVSLIMNPLDFGANSLLKRGDVITSIFRNACPPEFLTSPAPFFIELDRTLNYDRRQCFGDFGWIDSASGNFLKTSNSVDFFTNLNYTNRNRPINALVNDPAGTNALKFKSPSGMDSLATNDAYIIVTDFDSSFDRKKEKTLRIDIAVDNVLFWDSPDTNNVFSPQLDPNDRPNATNGTDNLRNTARKNLIFRLPTILSSFK
ncbi:sigma factor sigX-regulated lipoprotein SrpA [Leptospira santarosai]|uniref:Uncharacterized protein n=1 Tax=Leptospira santarosai serovar Arenal str. MAVJ 401 TaxID=1049976 RepID=M6JVJ6_9LEPT|nr:hypothetical protein [Leptospira santarosai]EMN23573.1 hypothetical protein LEP1GSC063_0657 [Leptospira santarosai serovar Arenal str. MAVJ 401]MDI7225858.1 hypothetical protein [Leptospira santarosai]MDI7228838.1 hypothetical protein [Leptospira santarosai]